jgi:hypothetical protein
MATLMGKSEIRLCGRGYWAAQQSLEAGIDEHVMMISRLWFSRCMVLRPRQGSEHHYSASRSIKLVFSCVDVK